MGGATTPCPVIIYIYMTFKKNDKVICCGPIVPTCRFEQYKNYLNKIFTISYYTLEYIDGHFEWCCVLKETDFLPYDHELQLVDPQLMLFEL